VNYAPPVMGSYLRCYHASREGRAGFPVRGTAQSRQGCCVPRGQ
jgi:hypothetical protein